MDFWLQLAWLDVSEVNSFTEVDMHTCGTLTVTKGQFQKSQQVVNDSEIIQPPNCGTVHVHTGAPKTESIRPDWPLISCKLLTK